MSLILWDYRDQKTLKSHYGNMMVSNEKSLEQREVGTTVPTRSHHPVAYTDLAVG